MWWVFVHIRRPDGTDFTLEARAKELPKAAQTMFTTLARYDFYDLQSRSYDGKLKTLDGDALLTGA